MESHDAAGTRSDVASEGGGILTHQRSSNLRLLALAFALVVGLAIALGAMLSAAQAAPFASLKQFRVPTDNSQPRSITNGSDGNRWFTLGTENVPSKIGRITPAGDIIEFGPACDTCIVTDIIQGPSDVLYYTSNDPILGRITTDGVILDPIEIPNSIAVAGDLAVDGNEIWFTDFNNDSLWRYDVGSGQFTQFNVPEPHDAVVDAAGFVWFTAPLEPGIGRLNPETREVMVTKTTLIPRQLTIATDGDIWFTARFTPQGMGRVVPATGAVTEFPLTNVGPEGIAASPDGPVWFTQTTKGNIARITDDGVITEGKVVKNSEPFGITVTPDGDPWYTMLEANKIATLQLR
jgi:virginiamycin B lyase